MSQQVLLDNTVLSNFALVGESRLLRDVLSYRAGTVAEVVSEFETGVLLSRVPQTDWSWLETHILTADEQSLYQIFRRRLSAGEAACLAVAHIRKLAVMTDDRDARQLAIQYGIPISGTIGILLEAIRKNILDLGQANRVLHEMSNFGYRSPLAKLDSLL